MKKESNRIKKKSILITVIIQSVLLFGLFFAHVFDSRVDFLYDTDARLLRVALDRVDHGAEEDVCDDEKQGRAGDFEDVRRVAVCGGRVEAPVAVEGDVEEVVSVEDGQFVEFFYFAFAWFFDARDVDYEEVSSGAPRRFS